MRGKVRRYVDRRGDVLVFAHTEQVTSVWSQPVTVLEVAKRIAREISEMANQRDATITVRSRRIEFDGRAEWRGIAAVFKAQREAELELARQAETAYRRLVSDWQPKGAGATTGHASSKPSSGKQRGRASVPDPAL